MLSMTKTRLEAFSDGVIAILITIMVLELRVPHGDDLSALSPLWPVFISYVLSFIYLGIYWNNHHHLLPERTTVAISHNRRMNTPERELLETESNRVLVRRLVQEATRRATVAHLTTSRSAGARALPQCSARWSE